MDKYLKVIITAEIDNLKKGLSNAKKEVSDAVKKIKQENQGFIDSFNKMAEGSKKALTAVGATLTGLATALIANTAATAEYRRNQDLLVSSFETAGASAGAATQVYNDLYRVLGDDGQTTEAAQHLAQLTNSQQSLSEWTNICQGVYATFSASLPIESLTEAANETAKTGQLTGALADALNWAGVNEEAFQAQLDACNTEAEREALIRKTLNGIYADAATNYETNAAATLRQNEANAAMTAQLAKLGEAFAPIMTALTELGTKVLAMITPYIEDFAEKHLPTLQSILEKVAEAIGAVIGWIVDNWSWISELGTVILAVAAAFTALQTAVSLANTIMTVMSMNPIILAITALIAVIALCVIHWDDIKAAAVAAWEGIKNAWNAVADWFGGVVDGIKGAFDGIGDWFSTTFSNAWQGIQNAWSNTKTWFSQKWEDIKGAFAKTKEWFSDTFQKARDGAEKAWTTVGTWAKDTWGKVQTGFKDADTWMTNKFGDAWTGIKEKFAPFTDYFRQCWETVKGIFSVVKNVLSGNFNDAWLAIKGIFSGWGNFFSGLWQSVKDIFVNIGGSIGNAVKGAVSTAINKVLSTAVGIINGFISAINFAIDVINAIPGVNIRKINKLDVPKMAKGGIVDSATLAVVGEKGKEAVMPLENNLEWLDKLASMLNDRMGGNQPIVLNVDGKRFGEIAYSTINDITRQRGKIPLLIY